MPIASDLYGFFNQTSHLISGWVFRKASLDGYIHNASLDGYFVKHFRMGIPQSISGWVFRKASLDDYILKLPAEVE